MTMRAATRLWYAQQNNAGVALELDTCSLKDGKRRIDYFVYRLP
jgi:hypothetical protein